jgi:hypothetical protein
MSTKVKFVLLPLTSVLVAAALLMLGHQQLEGPRGGAFRDFGPPATRLAHAMNAPASAFRLCVLTSLNAVGLTFDTAAASADNAIFLIGVGLLWLFISSRNRARTDIAPQRLSLQIGAYSLAILLGMLLTFLGVGNWFSRHLFGMPMSEVIVETVLYIGWGLLIIFIYSRDFLMLILSLSKKKFRAPILPAK